MNVIIVGGLGKLGKNICECLKEKAFTPIIVDLNAEAKNIYDINKNLQIDAIIDVSSHENSLVSLMFAKEKNIPIIIGCTGHTKTELEQIKSASSTIPVLLAYNFSIALQYFYKATELLSCLNSVNYITEAHHNKKIDKPSGTALELKKIISKKCSKP